MKKIFFLLLAMLFSGMTFAQTTISEKQARNLAETFVNSNNHFKTNTLTLVRESNVYVYNLGNQGFVMVSGNQVLPPILGYSYTDPFVSLEDAPEHLVDWILHYDAMIDYAMQETLVPEPKILTEWDRAFRGDFGTKGGKSIDPIIETHWNQDCYYNEYCPSTGNLEWWQGGGPCGHVYAGCVACAMAQVMKYWNYPAQGIGSHSYIHSTYGMQSADFGATTYHWDQMPETIYSHNDAIATLMYHCGVSVNMNYAGTGSGAHSNDVETALRSYFGYCGCKYREKRSYSEEDWIALLKSDLDQLHPVYYSGSSGTAGHAFVCDGYDDNNLFHFNFGWSGGGDSFYSLYDVNGYNASQAAVFNIIPMDIRPDSNGIIHVSADGEGNGTSWEQATPHLEYATLLANTGNNSIWVKKGVYHGNASDEENAFIIAEGNKVYGGFKGDEGPDYDLSQRDFVHNATILDGQGVKRVLCQDKPFGMSAKAVWDGFTIRNGNAGAGAGVYIENYVTLENCIIEENVSETFGGGIYVNASESNQVNIIRCRIRGNSASMGGGICDRNGINLTNCVISNNIAHTKGGGAFVYNNATPTLRGCVISNNTAKEGGGLFARGNCKLYNCNLVMNEALETSGGLYNENQYSIIANCILWGNIANGEYQQSLGEGRFQYCAVQGGMEGEENIDLPAENTGDEPGGFVRFKKPADGPGADYTTANWDIYSRSICLNAGKPGSAGYSTDLAGRQRLQHGRVDIGAYERNASLTLVDASIWEGQTYWFNSRPLHEPGYYTTLYQTSSCDSVVGLTLSVTLETEEYSLEIAPSSIRSIDVIGVTGQYLGSVKSMEALRSMDLKAGCYLLRIHTDEGIRNKKMIIQ